MFELTVTAFCPDVTPTVVFKRFDDFADFHKLILHHYRFAAEARRP